MRRPLARGPFAYRGFVLFVVATLVSVLGTSMGTIALAFAVLDLTGSARDLGVVLAARSLPLLLFLLVGGVVADRLPRDRVLAWSSAVSALAQGATAALLLGGVAKVWQLAALGIAGGAASAFVLPAIQGLIPQLVPRSELQRANALSSMVRNAARIGGTALGGIVVAAAGSGWALAFDALTFAVATPLFLALRLGHRPGARPHGSTPLRDLREGWTEFTARRWLWRVVAGFAVINMVMAGAWSTIGPVVADATVGRRWWGVILACYAAGVLLGVAAMARLAPPRPLFLGVACTAAHVPLLTVLALAPRAWPLAFAAVLAGFGLGLFNVAWDTAMQQHVAPERLSRVASYDTLGSFLAIPAGQLAAGYLATRLAPSSVLLAAAALTALAVLSMLGSPDVRRLIAAPADT